MAVSVKIPVNPLVSPTSASPMSGLPLLPESIETGNAVRYQTETGEVVLVLDSAIRSDTMKLSAKTLPECPKADCMSTFNAVKKLPGAFTTWKRKYECGACNYAWQQIPPENLKPGENPQITVIGKRVQNCGYCGQPRKGHVCTKLDSNKKKKMDDKNGMNLFADLNTFWKNDANDVIITKDAPKRNKCSRCGVFKAGHTCTNPKRSAPVDSVPTADLPDDLGLPPLTSIKLGCPVPVDRAIRRLKPLIFWGGPRSSTIMR